MPFVPFFRRQAPSKFGYIYICFGRFGKKCLLPPFNQSPVDPPPTPNDSPARRVRVRRPVTPKVAPKATVRGRSHESLLTQPTLTDARDTAQALGSGKKPSTPGSGSARGSASIPKAAPRSTPKSAPLAGLEDTAANSPRAAPPAAAGAVAVEEVELSLEGMTMEEPASKDPKQRVLSQVNMAELPGTAGAGAAEAQQILAGAFPALVSLFMLYSRVGSECVTLAEATTLGLEGFRKLLKDAPSLEVVGMGADAMAALFARCLTGQPQPSLMKKAPPAANKAGAAPLKAGAATKKAAAEDTGPPPIPPEQVQLQLFEAHHRSSARHLTPTLTLTLTLTPPGAAAALRVPLATHAAVLPQGQPSLRQVRTQRAGRARDRACAHLPAQVRRRGTAQAAQAAGQVP